MTQEEFSERYLALSHAIQTGVGHLQERGLLPDNRKHLRVGINMALIDSAAIHKVLVDKGICTQSELWEALISLMEEEVKRYEKKLSEHYQANIKLG